MMSLLIVEFSFWIQLLKAEDDKLQFCIVFSQYQAIFDDIIIKQWFWKELQFL